MHGNAIMPARWMIRSALIPALLLLSCAAPGEAEVRTHDTYGADGSSVLFPGVTIDKDTFYDLRTAGGVLLVTSHGEPNVMEPYANRGHFFPNGTFLLRNLTKEDSGTYEHVVNMTVQVVINLHVIGEVSEPTLCRQDLKEDHGQCLIKLECGAGGEGLFNMSFLKDGKDVSKKITRMDNVSTLSLHGWDPDSFGNYTCTSSNPVSRKTSQPIMIPPAGMIQEQIIVHVIGAAICHWCVYIIIWSIRRLTQRKNKEQQSKDTADQHVSSPSKVCQAITRTTFSLGFPLELFAACIFLNGHFIPLPWCYVSATLGIFCMVCRILCCLNIFNCKFFFNVVTDFSDFLGVPVFCSYVLTIFFKTYYGGPCGAGILDRGRWGLPIAIYGLIFFILCFINYTYIAMKHKKKESGMPDEEHRMKTSYNVTEEDTGEPGENMPLRHVEHHPTVGILDKS